MTAPELEPLMKPAEVADLFRVDLETVRRWGKAGRLTAIRTPGGRRLYNPAEIRALLAGTGARS